MFTTSVTLLMEPRVQKGFLVLTRGIPKQLMELIPSGFLTLQSPGYYIHNQFNVHQIYVLSTQCLYVFSVDLRTTSDCIPIQHSVTGF